MCKDGSGGAAAAAGFHREVFIYLSIQISATEVPTPFLTGSLQNGLRKPCQEFPSQSLYNVLPDSVASS